MQATPPNNLVLLKTKLFQKAEEKGVLTADDFQIALSEPRLSNPDLEILSDAEINEDENNEGLADVEALAKWIKDEVLKEKVNNVSVNNYPRGLLKRRLATYNLVAKTGEEAADIVTTSVETNGKRTGTKYDIRKADGTVLKSWTKPDLNETLGTLSVN